VIILIDNYDSFTWNLADLVSRHAHCEVLRNDAVSVNEVLARNPKGILISPGPGKPHESGICQELLTRVWGEIPVLGVCLGHQLLAKMSGATVRKATQPMHGKTDVIRHANVGVFAELPQSFEVMRYHSLIVEAQTLGAEWEIHAETFANEVMGIRHRSLPIEGVQFHPESILTQHGEAMIRNWLLAHGIV
jgi:anthranilate synthase/aminodeoxychorismate synthase-like glutamine amidotransferase